MFLFHDKYQICQNYDFWSGLIVSDNFLIFLPIILKFYLFADTLHYQPICLPYKTIDKASTRLQKFNVGNANINQYDSFKNIQANYLHFFKQNAEDCDNPNQL